MREHVSDESDMATEQEQMATEFAIRQVRETTKLGPQATGQCHYCGEPLENEKRWCDASCRDDWERLQRAN